MKIGAGVFGCMASPEPPPLQKKRKKNFVRAGAGGAKKPLMIFCTGVGRSP